MSYRDRRRRRAERLREWADKRQAKADAAHGAASEIGDRIPFGQPVLAGHHSQRRHERDLDRMAKNMDASVEHSAKAKRFREKAANIDAAADRAIYDDDPDAPDRLAERIAGLEAERDRIKAYNATCRKGTPDLGLLDEAQREDLLSLARVGMSRPDQSFPSYKLTNLGGNIRRLRQRRDTLRER